MYTLWLIGHWKDKYTNYVDSLKLTLNVRNAPTDMCARITKTRLFKYIENFTTKNEKLQMKISDIFHISAQSINCGYSLEPPQ